MVFASVLGAGQPGGAADRPKMATDIPPQITTPDTVNTRLGTLKFFDGYPDAETVQKVYDNLDFIRGVEVFLNTMPGASLYAMREGLKGVGINNSTVGISETLLDSKSLFLTPNTETVYLVGWLDLKDGPMVIETPPNILGFLDDFWFRYIIDMGNAGPDQGKGGKFIVLPPDYKGPVPKSYFVAKSHTYGVWLAARGFLVKGDPKPAVQAFKKHFRMYPFALARKPPKTNFINLSGKAFNTIHASNARFYDEVDHIVQEEPNVAQDPELLGQLASIGIVKGKPFAPDARMKKILDDAAAVGNATARAVLTAPREDSSHLNADTQWQVGFSGGYEFLEKGVRRLDARVRMFYYATGITPAMATKMVGVGSQYSSNWRDVNGNPLDGAKTYRLHLPSNPPAKDFWSIVLYDNQTRSELQTDQRFPSINSQKKSLQKNNDGSVDLYFGPTPPRGKISNWVQTLPGKGWNTLLRLYGPLDPWFDKSWRPGDFEEIAGAASGKKPKKPVKPKMATRIPIDIQTPAKVETRIGTLEFIDGIPTEQTVRLVYEHLDFMRGVEVFLNTMPGASVFAASQGIRESGLADGDIGVTETLMDSRSLFLTPNTETVYAMAWLDLKGGPVVVESPPNTLGIVDDFWFRYVTDLGNVGPDKGKGGKYLFLPPNFTGSVPKGYFVFRSPTFGNLLFWRGFVVKGDTRPAVENFRKHAKIYPLSSAGNPPQQKYLNISGKEINTIHANDVSFYEEVNALVQEEPNAAQDPELLGLLAGIGIEKGRPFAPDDRTKGILSDAAAVANATARAIVFATRDRDATSIRTANGRCRSSGEATNSFRTACGSTTRAHCSTTMPRVSHRRWRRRW